MTRLRCLLGLHADGAPYSDAPGTLNVRCVECGRVSSGVVLASEPPIVTQPITRQQRALALIANDVRAWKRKYAA